MAFSHNHFIWSENVPTAVHMQTDPDDDLLVFLMGDDFRQMTIVFRAEQGTGFMQKCPAVSRSFYMFCPFPYILPTNV
jgi:hypothetical protein